MTLQLIGRVENVELREIWPDEARNFTPWLATEDGLALLGEAINLDLELVQKEAKVGPFSADILARVVGEEDHLVVVENQYSKTDHGHLGQLITYASGLKARTIVWIADTFTDEHRQALDWLNDHKGDSAGFFGLEIYAIRIGESLPAPQFRVVSSPNIYIQAVRESREEVEPTATKLDQQRFWDELRELLKLKKSFLPVRKALPQHWYDIAIGRSFCHLALTVNTKMNRAGCELYMHGPQAKQMFDILLVEREAIESELGCAIEWMRLEGKEACRIIAYKEGSIYNSAQRQELKEWLHITAERFHRTFAPRVRALKLGQGAEEAIANA